MTSSATSTRRPRRTQEERSATTRRALLEATIDVLVEEGYEIVAAADGEQAIEQFDTRARPIELVISDLMMRGLTGRETI
ncbi:MAG: response regulator, partial [Actinophytocola sp.]|nr:response regulator [Actinophytocola sp.]